MNEKDSMTLIGVKSDGTQVAIASVPATPRMKARQLVIDMFGYFEEEDGSDADLAFVVCEQLIDFMEKNK